MADPSPRPTGHIPEGLSSRPLSILRPLGGLGFRLQRYVPLGARPLAVSRSEPIRLSRSERFLPTFTVESSDPSALIQPPLNPEFSNSPAEFAPESIQRQLDEESPPPAPAPLKAGDILPPPPKTTAIQRQHQGTPPPAPESLKAGDILPPSPKTTAIQRQQAGTPPSAPESLKAGDILPPSPKTTAIQRQPDSALSPIVPDISRQLDSEPSTLQPSGSGTVTSASDQADAGGDQPAMTEPSAPLPEVQRSPVFPVSAPAASAMSAPQVDRSSRPEPIIQSASQPDQPGGALDAPVDSPADNTSTISDVEGSDVEGSDVEGSEVEGSEVEGSEVEGSEVEGSEVEGSEVEGSRLSRSIASESAPTAVANEAIAAANLSPNLAAIQPQQDAEISASHPPLDQIESPADEVISPSTETSLQRTLEGTPASSSEQSETTQAEPLSSATVTPIDATEDTTDRLSEAPSIQRQAIQRQAIETTLATSEAASVSENPISEPANQVADWPKAEPILDRVTPSLQRRETSEIVPSIAPGEDLGPVSTPVSQDSPYSPMGVSASTSPTEIGIQTQALESSNLEAPSIPQGSDRPDSSDLPSAEVTPAVPSLLDPGNVQRIAEEPSSAAADLSASEAPTPVVSSATSSPPSVTPEVTVSQHPAVQREATVSAIEGTDVATQDSTPVISRSPESVLEDSSDNVSSGAATAEIEAPFSGGTENALNADAIAQDAPTTIQRRVNADTDTPVPQIAEGGELAGDLQRIPRQEVTPGGETEPKTEPLSSPDRQTLASGVPTISRAAETLKTSSAESPTDITPALETQTIVKETSIINRAAATVDAPIALPPEVEAIPVAEHPTTADAASPISRKAETIETPTASPSEAEVTPVAESQTIGDNASPISRKAEAIDAPIALPTEVEAISVAENQTTADAASPISPKAKAIDIPNASSVGAEVPPIAENQTNDNASTIRRAAETIETPIASPFEAEVTPIAKSQAVDTDASTTSEPTSTPDSPETTTPPENITVSSPNAPDIDLPKLSTVLKPLSVIQPFRSPHLRMTVTNPDDLAMLPSAPSEPPKTVPPISPPEAPAPSPSGSVIQRRTETAASTSIGTNEADASESTSDDYSQQFPSMPSPDQVMAALAGLSASQSPTVQRKQQSRSGDTSSSEQATTEEPSTSVDKFPQVQRKAMAQPPPTEWSDVESLFNTSKSQQTRGSTSTSPSTSASSDSYSNLKPFETIQRKKVSDTIQREEEAATIATSFDESGESSASPEALNQLVHQVYVLICQRLAVERERYGLSRRR